MTEANSMKTLPIESIKIGSRRSLGDITELANSIKTIGLLNPITVTKDFKLIAGHHRLKACISLGYDSITVKVLDLTDVEAKIAEIDENLIRNELTAFEQSKQLAERKALYLELYPETKQGGDRGNQHTGGKERQNVIVTFCQDTAKKTGKSKSTIEKKTRIGESLAGLEDDIVEAGIDDSQADLTELAKLKEKAPDKVKEVISHIKSGKAKTVKAAIVNIESDKKTQAISTDISENKPEIYCCHYRELFIKVPDKSVDLLITDPPYSTDVDDIEEFVADWVPSALNKIKDGGRAYICIGAYPIELYAYLNVLINDDRFILDNPLIWTYRNTLGVTPKDKYNLNYQVILHLYQKNSQHLDTSITNEMFSVQDINAPDGRVGDRFHTWQKPEELALRLVRHSTKEGDLILDPFTCTGTFPITAAKLNRKAIGCDISAENLKIAEKRGCHVIF